MGQQILESATEPERRRVFMQRLLTDVRALERMIDEGLIETGVRRIGAEQELALADRSFRPSRCAMALLEALDDPMFTTELAQFNLEFNLEPLRFEGRCLTALEDQLATGLARVEEAADAIDARVVLTGILPTIRKSDLGTDSMTPLARYRQLDEALLRLRGGPYEFRFTGTDELLMRHDSVMLEACNTSCQFHFQVSPDEFARFYNIAQACVGPVLAAAVNSPLLMGRRLWAETRIGLFQQAVDTRRPSRHIEQRSARVRFGSDWVRRSILEIFREDIARFRVILAQDDEEDSLSVLESGGIPRLRALQLHNGTVYRWNRACYGVLDGIPTLRIENRVFPSGPTVLDEVANAAFWYGLISGAAARYDDITQVMSFDVAKSNFLLASRLGLDSYLGWVDGRKMHAPELILEHLLPLAHEGLRCSGIDGDDANRYLGVIERRVGSGQTGSAWLVQSYDALRDHGTGVEQLVALTGAMWTRRQQGRPVHEWTPIRAEEVDVTARSYHHVEQIMTRDVFSVHEDDVIDLAASMMDWEHIRHVPVEDDLGRLVGLISYRQLLRFLANELSHRRGEPVAAKEVMQREPVTVPPDMRTLDAISLMRTRKIPCLPVVNNGELVGIVTERDFLEVAAHWFEQQLRANGASDADDDAESPK